MGYNAGLMPFRSAGSDAENLIEIYVVTGRHSFLRIPEGFCKECNMFYHAAEEAVEESEADVDIVVKSYWTRFLRPLVRGGFHPPVLMVNGKVVAQGIDVPSKDMIIESFN